MAPLSKTIARDKKGSQQNPACNDRKQMANREPAPEVGPRPAAQPTRDALLAAASALMIDGDTIEISLSDLAQKARLNTALVKYYFGNKQGLMLALLDRDLSMALRQLDGLLAISVPPTRKMEMHISGMIRLYFQFPYLQRLMMTVIRDGGDEIAAKITGKFIRPLTDAYAIIISDGVATGEFKPVDPMLFYFTIIGACDQVFSAPYVLHYVYGIDRIDDDLRRRFALETAQVLLTGLKS